MLGDGQEVAALLAWGISMGDLEVMLRPSRSMD